ncbi:LytR/AlgR family response regulator transcription factor [Mucilaginibacter lacusdianchii]|uniref:LytR/AlgR family response regulator transcription factor n=1 Tax=Mucilaginibacter lacusdianchii TaxID=2684211 RepID=UPI00131B0C25|nr:LytTR family DNA-binding domain-containing protein [Mucilaginibacter sp. JXJ CY 39]
MIKAIAIDDEPFALEVIRSHAGKVPFLDLSNCFTEPLKAIAYLANEPVQLLFLDIKMPDITGIELMQSLAPKPLVVFTTAYAEHAAQSYELDAVDYLLKPFSFPRFLKACHKAHELLQYKTGQKADDSNGIFIKSGYESVKVNFQDILYLESAGNYVTFVMANRNTILTRLTMSEAMTLLPATTFVRVHRSYIVNKFHVDRKERHQIHIKNYCIPISSAFATDLD